MSYQNLKTISGIYIDHRERKYIKMKDFWKNQFQICQICLILTKNDS